MATVRLVTRLNLFFALMLGLCVAGAALSVWSAQRAHDQILRITLANAVYHGFLSLESNTYQLFKQYGDAMLIGDRDGGEGERALKEKIRVDIAEVRAAIGQEIEQFGEEEIAELELLAEIERKIEELIQVLSALTNGQASGVLAQNWRSLSDILDGDIDRDFRLLIDLALEEEVEEVREAMFEADATLHYYQALSIGFAVLAALAAIAGLLTMYRHLSQPLAQLADGMRAFAHGETGFRFGQVPGIEFGGIARTFDDLAERVTERTAELDRERERLQQAVEERTVQLEQLLEDAKRGEAQRRRLLADVSHELRTPLTIIRGEAEIALRGGDKPLDAYKEALGRTRDAAAHTAHLVDDLLFIARNESGELRLAKEPVDLARLLRDTVSAFGQPVEIDIDIEPAPLQADPVRLRQVLLILLDNAHKHGGRHVWARLQATPEGYRIAVEDNGPGMSEAERRSAFERFFRGSGAAARYLDGVGLGLPVAQAIAEAHSGVIALDDRPGGGLIAALFLPGRPRLKAVS